MENELIPPEARPTEKRVPARWFVFYKRKMLLFTEGDRPIIPLSCGLDDLGLHPQGEIYLGTLEGKPCYGAVLSDPAEIREGMTFFDLWPLHERLGQDMIYMAFRAIHLLDWSRKNRFCSQCGGEMGEKDGIQAKECPACGILYFPRISPAVIVLVERGDRCLLASSPRFKNDFYSTLAGFAEPGETLEETVAREVREETGIEVKDIRYFGSQPWPFPDSLMIGFTAQYAGGEIRADGTEIEDAQWFSFDRLPKIPGKISIARNLIDWFVAKHQNK